MHHSRDKGAGDEENLSAFARRSQKNLKNILLIVATSLSNYWARLLGIVVIVLAGICFAASWQACTELPQASHSTAYMTTVAGGVSDTNANPDDLATTHPFEAFGIVSASVLLLEGDELLLVASYRTAKLICIYSMALERPG